MNKITEKIQGHYNSSISRKMLLDQFKQEKTLSEAIDEIFAEDCRSGMVANRGWKFYANYQKSGLGRLIDLNLIEEVGYKYNRRGVREKIWRLKRKSKIAY